MEAIKAIVLWHDWDRARRPPVVERMYAVTKQSSMLDPALCWVISITQRKRESPQKDVFDVIATEMYTGATVPMSRPHERRTLGLARKEAARMATAMAKLGDLVIWKDGATVVGPSHGGSLR